MLLNGIVVIAKTSGTTSHQVVREVRKLLPGVKAGHTGTLDPMATGVLPICLGKATRLVEYIIELPKTYRASLTFGVNTDTGDADGDVIDQKPVPELRLDLLENILAAFHGTREQLPPRYSAVKYKGKPLYRWTREGSDVPRKSRQVDIYEITIIDFQNEHDPHLVIEVKCSKGTYIRTLAEDIGEAIGCGAFLSALSRTSVGPYKLENAITIEDFTALVEEGEHRQKILALDSALQHLSAMQLNSSQLEKLKHGQLVDLYATDNDCRSLSEGLFRLYDEHGNFKALGNLKKEEYCYTLRTVKYLSE